MMPFMNREIIPVCFFVSSISSEVIFHYLIRANI